MQNTFMACCFSRKETHLRGGAHLGNLANIIECARREKKSSWADKKITFKEEYLSSLSFIYRDET